MKVYAFDLLPRSRSTRGGRIISGFVRRVPQPSATSPWRRPRIDEAREIKAQMRDVDAGVLMGLFQFGNLPHPLAKRNIELFAKTVLPELERA